MEAEDRVSRLESGLAEAREQAQIQQNTLDDILQLLQNMPGLKDIRTPENPVMTLRTPAPTDMNSTLHMQARGLKPATPSEFDGDRIKGRAFLNSCRLYISLCDEQFRDEQAQIHWALSFMKSGRAALYANRILRKEALDDLPAFFQWRDFERDFVSKFCQKDEATAAMTKLESTRYYQGRKSVDDYIDEFSELVDEAGYTDGLAIVMKFRKGLDRDIQDRIAEMVQGRPNDADPQGWYNAAQLLDANKSANQAFHGSQRTAPPVPNTRSIFPVTRNTGPAPTNSEAVVNFRPSASPGVPARGSNIPVPMEVDATRRRNPIPMLCRRCGEPGHFAKECPRSYDVRYMTSEEKEEWIEQLLSDADVAKTEIPDLTASSHATDPPQENPADFTSHSG